MSGGSQNIKFTIQAINQFSATFQSLENQLQGATSQFQALERVGQTAGKALAGLGAAGAVGMGLAVNAAANFQAAMDSVKAVSGASAEEMSKLTELAKEMGATTSFSASEAAKGI